MSTTSDRKATVEFVFACAAQAYNDTCNPPLPITSGQLQTARQGPDNLGLWRDVATYVAREMGAGPAAIARATGLSVSTINERITTVRWRLKRAPSDRERHAELRQALGAIYDATLPSLAPAGS